MKQHFLGKISDVMPGADVVSPTREVSVPTDEAPCPEHPDFRPERRLDTQPRAQQCPQCLAEIAESRRHTGSSREWVENPRRTNEASFAGSSPSPSGTRRS